MNSLAAKIDMQKIAQKVVSLFDRFMPEPFAFGVLMTFVAMFIAWSVTDAAPIDVLVYWGQGLSSLLPFITQVCLTILFAFALAHLGPVPRLLETLADVPKTPSHAYAFAAMFTSAVCLLAWPLGTILGGLMAREIALRFKARGDQIHYPLLGGAAFSGFVVWHMGYSASAPLLVATEGNPMQEMIGGLIPVTDTLLNPYNLMTIVATVAVVAYMATRLAPQAADIEEIDDSKLAGSTDSHAREEVEQRSGFASRFENARWPTTLMGLLLFTYVGYWFYTRGAQLELNIVNWTFLGLCLLLARNAANLIDVMMQAGRAVIPTLLQYPLYGGIMGLMMGTGVVAIMANYFAEIGSAETLPLIAFFSGGLINLFIPSGGAQWAVQGPAFLEAAELLGTEPALIVMGVAYGDQWTNIIHPFVVIPLLIMTGLKASKVLSYSFILFVVATLPLAGGLLMASIG